MYWIRIFQSNFRVQSFFVTVFLHMQIVGLKSFEDKVFSYNVCMCFFGSIQISSQSQRKQVEKTWETEKMMLGGFYARRVTEILCQWTEERIELFAVNVIRSSFP